MPAAGGVHDHLVGRSGTFLIGSSIKAIAGQSAVSTVVMLAELVRGQSSTPQPRHSAFSWACLLFRHSSLPAKIATLVRSPRTLSVDGRTRTYVMEGQLFYGSGEGFHEWAVRFGAPGQSYRLERRRIWDISSVPGAGLWRFLKFRREGAEVELIGDERGRRNHRRQACHPWTSRVRWTKLIEPLREETDMDKITRTAGRARNYFEKRSCHTPPWIAQELNCRDCSRCTCWATVRAAPTDLSGSLRTRGHAAPCLPKTASAG